MQAFKVWLAATLRAFADQLDPRPAPAPEPQDGGPPNPPRPV